MAKNKAFYAFEAVAQLVEQRTFKAIKLSREKSEKRRFSRENTAFLNGDRFGENGHKLSKTAMCGCQ
jgi:hypothetical protein